MAQHRTPQPSVPALPAASDSAWLFPGQGAQHVGMGRDLYEQSPVAQAVFDAADAALGFPLSALCFDGPEDDLTRTVNTQPALVTHSVAALLAAIDAGTVTHRPAFVAGHSLGEYAALIAAGAIGFDDGLRLVRERGRLMQEACDAHPGTMAAVLGLEPDAVAPLCEQHGVSLCNVNAPGNITVGGAPEAVEGVTAAATAAGATRVVPLDVAGAFHTPLMQSAGRRPARGAERGRFRRPADAGGVERARPVDRRRRGAGGRAGRPGHQPRALGGLRSHHARWRGHLLHRVRPRSRAHRAGATHRARGRAAQRRHGRRCPRRGVGVAGTPR